MKRGATVVIESTVYPGCTEEDCVPVIERASGLRWREGFHVGYSPERINPGDKQREYGIKLEPWDSLPRAELVVLAVPHRQLLARPITEYNAKSAPGTVFVDVKSRLDPRQLTVSGFAVWRL